MINIFKPYVSSIAKFKLAEVLSSGTLTQGHVVDEFENLLEYESGIHMMLIHRGNRGRKSHATVPFKSSQ